MKLLRLTLKALLAAAILVLHARTGIAQTNNYHTGISSELAQIDKELAETRQQQADAEAAAAAARKEVAAARKQAGHLWAQRAKAATPEEKKAFDDAIAQAQADMDRASAEAQENATKATERIQHAAALEFERIKYATKAKEEEQAPKN